MTDEAWVGTAFGAAFVAFVLSIVVAITWCNLAWQPSALLLAQAENAAKVTCIEQGGVYAMQTCTRSRD